MENSMYMQHAFNRETIKKAFASPAGDRNPYPLANMYAIRVHITNLKDLNTLHLMGYYCPDEIKLDLNELTGMIVHDAIELLAERQNRYIQLTKLLKQEEYHAHTH